MGIYDVPGVGTVDVELNEHRFGMTGAIWWTVRNAPWPNGGEVTCRRHEITAQHLDILGII